MRVVRRVVVVAGDVGGFGNFCEGVEGTIVAVVKRLASGRC